MINESQTQSHVWKSHSRLLDSNKQLQCQGTQIDQNNRNCMYTVIACFLGSQDQNDIRKWDVSLSDMVWQGFWACTAINLIRTPDMKFDTNDYNAAVGGQTFARRSVFATIFHFWQKKRKGLKTETNITTQWFSHRVEHFNFHNNCFTCCSLQMSL